MPVVFVVDDDQDARDSICALVRSMGLPCQPYASADHFLQQFDPALPGCLVTDLRMRGTSGLELLQQLHARRSSLPAIVISAFAGVENTVRAMKLGAVMVLPKPYRDQELWESVQDALKRNQEIRENLANRDKLQQRFAALTEGERDVLELIVTGVPNKTVAKRLDISVRAVEDRRRRIMKKLNVDSFARLMEMVLTIRQA
ncbi:MAG: response regulator transcription factor [Pirellulaceae bacterium]